MTPRTISFTVERSDIDTARAERGIETHPRCPIEVALERQFGGKCPTGWTTTQVNERPYRLDDDARYLITAYDRYEPTIYDFVGGYTATEIVNR